MLKMYSISNFMNILKQQDDIHQYVLKYVLHMHFKPVKLIHFERHQIQLILQLKKLLNKYNQRDIVTLSTNTYICKITHKNKVLCQKKIDKNIVDRC